MVMTIGVSTIMVSDRAKAYSLIKGIILSMKDNSTTTCSMVKASTRFLMEAPSQVYL